ACERRPSFGTNRSRRKQGARNRKRDEAKTLAGLMLRASSFWPLHSARSKPLMTWMRLRAVLLLSGLFALLGLVKPDAPPEPRSPSQTFAPVISVERIASNLGSVTSIASAGDSRLFLTIQAGRILIYDGGILPTPFLDIANLVLAGGER